MNGRGMSIAVGAAVGLAALWPAAWSVAQEPVAAWSFNGRYRGLARDVATNRHHAAARSRTEYVESPGGHALRFDGTTSSVVVPNHPDLVVQGSVTLDAWVLVEDVDAPEPQCIVDKGGERYRLQLSPGGGVMFGLKNDGARMDLSGGKLTSGKWHRITGVFDRPMARLYVDAELVAETTWDQAIGAGNDLYMGSKGGVTYFLRGQVDEVRIYREPRPPAAADSPTTAIPGTGGVEPKMEVSEVPRGVTIDTGAAQFRLSRDGALESASVGGVEVVSGNATPLLSATLLESEAYDGWGDHAPGRTIEATPELTDMRVRRDGDSADVRWTARLEFEGGDAIAGEVDMALEAGSPFATTTVSLQPEGDFENRFLRSLAVRVPLSLNRRKRIVQGGDRGLRVAFSPHAPPGGLWTPPTPNGPRQLLFRGGRGLVPWLCVGVLRTLCLRVRLPVGGTCLGGTRVGDAPVVAGRLAFARCPRAPRNGFGRTRGRLQRSCEFIGGMTGWCQL